MIYKKFKDIKLSSLGMGNMRLPMNSDKKIDWKEAHKVIDLAYESGINYFDTAYVYNDGESERCLGACMNKYPRESYYIADKFNIMANPDYKAVFEEQLKRLDKEYIDFYLIHCLLDSNVDNYINSGCIEYFESLRKEGKIKYLGFSSHASVKTLDKMLKAHKWDFVQIQLNYYDYEFGSSKEEYELIRSMGIPVIVMEPVRGGKLAKLTEECETKLKEAHEDWTPASWALRFVNSLEGIQVVLSGMSDLNQVKDNINTFSDGYEFNSEDKDILKNVCIDYKKQIVVPCTACCYCVKGCPKKINIPAYFKAYNEFKVNGPSHIRDIKAVESEGKPSDCIKCCKCMKNCPQSIEIPKLLKDIADLLENNK